MLKFRRREEEEGEEGCRLPASRRKLRLKINI